MLLLLLLRFLLKLLLLDAADVVDRAHLRVLHEHTRLLFVDVVDDSGWFLVRLGDVNKLISQT